ncbi:MAG TPA: hypothetical protein HA254_05270, partial [Candidatus Diapherotrites archaeon]|nr:hypothetical protein [Candidatus Diapherotrites archaeon]
MDELDSALDYDEIRVDGANYFTNQDILENSKIAMPSDLKNAQETDYILKKVYGYQNTMSTQIWVSGGITSNKTSLNRAVILQSNGNVENGQLKLEDSFGYERKISDVKLNDSIQGGNLVITDVDYSGNYLPTMGKDESFSSQLSGKSGALVATNGFSNTAFVKSLICSLALQDYAYEENPYYKFSSLGDRVRNAKNNLAEFETGEDKTTATHFNLYGLPFAKTGGKKVSNDELSKYCFDFAKYNTFPSVQSVSVQAQQENGSLPLFTKSISLDFSDYSIVSENGFEIIELNGAMQRLREGELVLPQAVVEMEFPLGT